MFPDIWQRIVNWFRKRRRNEAAGAPAESFAAPAPAADPPPLMIGAQGLVPGSEKDTANVISFYEKQRLKHDKFVTPKGELPEREPRPRLVTQEIKPRLPKPDIDPNAPLPELVDTTGIGMNIVEPHHEDGGKVLFKGEELLGEFNFRDTILQQLDRYFFYLKRMKRGDPEAYGFYRRVGATLLPYLATGAWHRAAEDPKEPRPMPPLPAWFNAQRPGFGCYAYGTDPETEKFEQTYKIEGKPKQVMWVPKFLYFVKYKAPPAAVQPMSGGDVYMLTVWWDRPGEKSKHGVPQQMPVFISQDGLTVRALKTLETAWVPVRSRHGRFEIPSRRWQFLAEYRQWAKQFHQDVQTFLCRTFLDAITQSENSHLSMTRVTVTKGKMTAVFSVNIRRTAYFFQDRDIQVTKAGARQRVFHLVRPHVRRDGSVVKMHFRGVRDFTWAGYDVHISIPGLHHADIDQFDIGVVDEEKIEPGEKTLTTVDLGKRLARHIRGGWGTKI